MVADQSAAPADDLLGTALIQSAKAAYQVHGLMADRQAGGNPLPAPIQESLSQSLMYSMSALRMLALMTKASAGRDRAVQDIQDLLVKRLAPLTKESDEAAWRQAAAAANHWWEQFQRKLGAGITDKMQRMNQADAKDWDVVSEANEHFQTVRARINQERSGLGEEDLAKADEVFLSIAASMETLEQAALAAMGGMRPCEQRQRVLLDIRQAAQRLEFDTR